jgi:hypothetical protein
MVNAVSSKINVNHGDTWYGIVQAKYGVTGHKQTMEIVKAMKKLNGVDSKRTDIPKEIKLLNTVALKGGKKIKLQNIDAEVDKGHFKAKDSGSENPFAGVDNVPLSDAKYSKWVKDTAVEVQQSLLEQAKAAFQQQQDKDGGAAKTANFVSGLWGSEKKVKEDINRYEQQLESLTQAVEQSEGQYNIKFKEVYGIDYDQENVAAYLKKLAEDKATEEDYQKAFGTKNDIAKRVEDYNISQDNIAALIKAGAAITAAPAAIIANGGGEGSPMAFSLAVARNIGLCK